MAGDPSAKSSSHIGKVRYLQMIRCKEERKVVVMQVVSPFAFEGRSDSVLNKICSKDFINEILV